MRFNPPTKTTWAISALLIRAGVVLRLINIPVLSTFDFLLVTAGGVLLLLGTMMNKL